MGNRKTLIFLAGCLIVGVIGGVFYLKNSYNFPFDSIFERQENENTSALKIYTSEAGIYEIDISELEKYGFFDGSKTENEIRLFNNGREWPLWRVNKGGEIKYRFYAQEIDSLYTDENVYWLINNNEAIDERIESIIERWEFYPVANQIEDEKLIHQPIENPSNDSYYETDHIEQNNLYFPQVSEGDHWFWVSMVAPNEFAFDISLSNISGGSGYFRLGVWSATESNKSPDHHINVVINEKTILDKEWDGKGRKIIEGVIPEGVIKEGENVVSLHSPGDIGVDVDIVYIDYVEIDYPRKLIAKNGQIEFQSNGATQVISGYSGEVEVVDITHENAPRIIPAESIILERDDGQIKIKGEKNHRYLAVGPEGRRKPQRIEPVSLDPYLLSTIEEANYVAIGSRILLDEIEPLLKYREEKGLTTSAITLEVVYDQFNFGLPEPEGIERFIRYTAEAWKKPPEYILLVGDSSYDPKGNISTPQAYYLPVNFVSTQYGGETSSDVSYAQINNDGYPDIAIGILPARSKEQLSNYVSKVLTYENSISSDPESMTSLDKVIAIADGQEQNFQSDAQGFLDLFSENYQRELYAPKAGESGADERITKIFENGSNIISYFGHGSINMWGKDRLFSTQDVEQLGREGTPSIVINMTCLTGFYTHPKVESLAEALLWQPQAGAVAMLAPTSLTIPTDQSFLSRSVVGEILEGIETIGKIHLNARRQIPMENAGARDVMYTFLLFGDPALTMLKPAN